PLELPLGREPGVELAIRMATREVVEEVEGHADVIRGCAEMRVEFRDIPALRGDELLLLRGLSPGLAGERGGGAESGGAFQQLTSRHEHAQHLHNRFGLGRESGDGDKTFTEACQADFARGWRCRPDRPTIAPDA